MRNDARIAVVIPALDEERSIGKVIADIPDWVDDVVVADNGSTDRTVEVAEAAGARVVREPRRGYGSACLTAIAALREPDVVVFLDADYSDYPEEMDRLVDPILSGEFEMVIGSRVLGKCDPGALTPQQRFGNKLACWLIRVFWGVRYTDLGPFRAIRFSALKRLEMRDPDYGWTVEAQVKAAQRRMPVSEAPVSYRARVGKSKVSGTIRGVVGAGTKILYTIFAAALRGRETAPVAKRGRLIVFTRYPEPGKVKTRLIPAVGEVAAAKLHEDMTRHALSCAEQLRRHADVDIEIRFDGADASDMRRKFGQRGEYVSQGTGGLGEKMARAFAEVFDRGAERVVLVGTDCPGLNEHIIADAFDVLENHDLALGPATDGGYYLIGLRRAAPELFDDIPWGGADVLAKTLECATRGGISYKLVQELGDVDRPEDLPAAFSEFSTRNVEESRS